MNFEIFRPSEDLPASRKGTRKWLLSSVHPDVIDEFIFGLEGPTVPRTTLPVAGVVGLFWPSHVLDGDVGDYLVHGCEDFIAWFLWFRLVLVHPLACVFLFDGMPHKWVEGSWSVGAHIHSVMAHSVHGV